MVVPSGFFSGKSLKVVARYAESALVSRSFTKQTLCAHELQTAITTGFLLCFISCSLFSAARSRNQSVSHKGAQFSLNIRELLFFLLPFFFAIISLSIRAM